MLYPGLNAYRAFAFLAVFLCHEFKLHAGYLGVQAFFVLSGFLITPILVDMNRKLAGKTYFSHFYGRRALRIFPLYYFYLALVGVIGFVLLQFNGIPGMGHYDEFVRQLPWSALFLTNFSSAIGPFENTRLISHFWSLAVEEQFYLFWPIVIFLVPFKKLRPALLFFILTGPPIRWLIGSDFVSHSLPFLNQDIAMRVYVLPFSHVDAFAIGGYFALYGKSFRSGSVWALLGFTYVIGVATAWMATGHFVPSDLGYGPFMVDAGKHIWGYSLLNFTFAYVLIHVRDRKFLPWLFEFSPLNYLGKISYGLYVYHFAVIHVVNIAFADQHDLIRYALALFGTFVISAASYELMEKWFLKFKDVYFKRNDPVDESPPLEAMKPLEQT